MSIFQILILAAISLILGKSISRLVKKEITAIFFILWLIFWVMVALVDIFPEIINRLAIWLGVGRGVDLAIYFSIVVIFYFLFQLWLKIKKAEDKLNKIIEETAKINLVKREIKG